MTGKHLKNSIITIVPHETQRYDTAGDYRDINESWTEFRISEMDNPDYEFLLIVHEFIEEHLTRRRGITDDIITEWDVNHINHPDPGSIEGCPYHAEHLFATFIEKEVCHKLGIDWNEYSESFEKLVWRKK